MRGIGRSKNRNPETGVNTLGAKAQSPRGTEFGPSQALSSPISVDFSASAARTSAHDSEASVSEQRIHTESPVAGVVSRWVSMRTEQA